MNLPENSPQTDRKDTGDEIKDNGLSEVLVVLLGLIMLFYQLFILKKSVAVSLGSAVGCLILPYLVSLLFRGNFKTIIFGFVWFLLLITQVKLNAMR